MPLLFSDRQKVLQYCDRDLPSNDWFLEEFNFVEDDRFRRQLALEFYAARYIYKLGEALSVETSRLHAHVKFQITQYASIYEAVIVYLLWGRYDSHPAVVEIEFHKSYRKAVTLPATIVLSTAESEDIVLCVERSERTSRMSIKFADKVDAAIAIGFLDKNLGKGSKECDSLRNCCQERN